MGSTRPILFQKVSKVINVFIITKQYFLIVEKNVLYVSPRYYLMTSAGLQQRQRGRVRRAHARLRTGGRGGGRVHPGRDQGLQ